MTASCVILSSGSLFYLLYLCVLIPGTDKYGFGFGGTGKKSNNKQFDSYGEVKKEAEIFIELVCFFSV